MNNTRIFDEWASGWDSRAWGDKFRGMNGMGAGLWVRLVQAAHQVELKATLAAFKGRDFPPTRSTFERQLATERRRREGQEDKRRPGGIHAPRFREDVTRVVARKGAGTEEIVCGACGNKDTYDPSIVRMMRHFGDGFAQKAKGPHKVLCVVCAGRWNRGYSGQARR